MGLFTEAKQLEHKHLQEIAGLCAGVMILIFGAVFISGGGTANLLAANHIASVSQTGSVFPSNNTSDSLIALYLAPTQSSLVAPGASVTWVWNAGTYGSNTFSNACYGSADGYDECQVQLNSQPSFPLSGSSGNVDVDRFSCSNGGYCNGFGSSGGNTPTGSGYPGGYVVLTAPSTPGTYTYYFCSYWIEHAYGSGAGCASNSLTVLAPTILSSFSASPVSVPYNTATHLYYSGSPGTYGVGLYLTGGIFGGYVGGWSSSVNTGALTTPTTYNMYTEDSYYGQSLAGQVAVPVAASVTASATSSSPVTVGQSATISFHADSAQAPSACQILDSTGTTVLWPTTNISSTPCPTSPTTKTIYLTSGSTWTVPSDWNSANNSIEVIGGGGGSPESPAGQSSGGGGGGAYAKVSNVSLTPGSSITYQIGAGGPSGPVDGTWGPAGDSYVCNSTSNCASIAGAAVLVGAKGGNGANYYVGGAGGTAAASIGTVKYTGGSGGNGAHGGAGGGGAAGPLGNGGNGGNGGSGTYGYTGGSGGGNGGGSVGGDGGPFTSGPGGNNASGTGGGAGASFPSNGSNGSNGGGGSGGSGVYGHTNVGYVNGYFGGNGSSGTEWISTATWNGSSYTTAAITAGSGGGGGGGGGGAVNGSGVAGGSGSYGGGAGGPGMGGVGGWGGSGGSTGIIVVTYTPTSVAYGSSYTTPPYTSAGSYGYIFKYLQNGTWVTAQTVTVTVNATPPSCTLTASPNPIALSGNTTALSYTAANATSEAINQGVGTVGANQIASFTTPGTTHWTAPGGVTSIQLLVVGGGGAGSGAGGSGGGAGGGAGGVVYNAAYPVTPGATYTVTVGAGGTSVVNANGNNGGNSVFNDQTAVGGGAGAEGFPMPGNNGGSGGGGYYGGAGGSGIAGQGNTGGSGSASLNNRGGGGGGGAGAAGTNGTSNTGGNGGNGVSNSISGSAVIYAGGGAASASNLGYGVGVDGTAGTGGGGSAASINTGGNGGAATPNTGGGGGGAAADPTGDMYAGGAGGSGVVIVSYISSSVQTPAITASPTTFTMTITGAGGTNTCSVPVTITDVCTDISGFQPSLPSGCSGPTPSPVGICIPSGDVYNSISNSCVAAGAPPVSIGSFFGPGRVRSGNTAMLTYLVNNATASCTITGTNGYNSGLITPVSGIQGTATTTAITKNTQFTLTCGAVSLSTNVGITPVFQEQ